MAKPTKKAPMFTTPTGVFKFPRLNEPDTKFKPEGEYTVKLVLSLENAQPLIDTLQPLFDQAVAAGEAVYKALPVKTRKQTEFKTTPFFSPIYDEQTEEETGDIEFTFKMKASGTNKKTGKPWSRKPVIFDAKGTPLTKAPAIWGGTVGKVSFSVPSMFDDTDAPGFYTTAAGAGLSMRLEAVQIIDLVSGAQRNAAGYGFGEEEGFSASDMTDEDEPAASDDDDASDDGVGATDF